jgi:Protein of unknown function (DUF1552)
MGKLTRRRFGLGMGAALLASPFLDFLERPARAGAGVAKRLVVMFSPNGTIPAHWTPSGSGTSYSFPSGSILEPLGTTFPDPAGVLPAAMLAPIQKDVIVCGGLDFVSTANHDPGMLAMLTGNGDATTPSNGMSVDQYIAAQIGKSTKFSSLQFGVQTTANGGGPPMSYSAPNVSVPYEDDPVTAYALMFGALVGDPAAAALLLNEQKSILDLAEGELAVLRARVGAAEQAKLDAHLASLRAVEQELSTPSTCAAPTAPTSLNYAVNDNFPAIGKAQMDLLVTSLACGMTNVASLQFSFTVGQPSLDWLGFSDEHHSLSHSDDSDTVGVGKFVTAERWFAQQFVYLVNKLKSTPDPSTPGSTSLLDTTLVVWTKELADSRAHVCTGVPFVLAGTANGRFTTGRYTDFMGAPHNQLLVSICQAMGLTNTTFGDPTVASGPLAGLIT